MPKIPSKNRKPITIGIVGSRRRTTYDDCISCRLAFFKIFKRGDKIVSGGCTTGGDAFAEGIAKMHGISILIHYPDWNGPDGKRAGFVRNSLIAEDCDVLIALVADDRTGGTEDTIKKVLVLGKKVILC